MTFTDNHFPPMKKLKFTVLFNWTFIACTGMTTSIKTFVHSAIEQQTTTLKIDQRRA